MNENLYENAETFGPKMRRLSPMRRAFVVAIMAQDHRNASEAARAAGYSSTSPQSLATQASNLWHADEIQEAILEEAEKRLKGLLPAAVATVEEIMANPQEGGAVRLKAATSIMDRAGLHAVSEQIKTDGGIANNPDQLKRIVQMAQTLGLPVEKLLGKRLAQAQLPAPTDVEFMEMSVEGLDGLI